MKQLGILTALLLLSACQTPEQIALQKKRQRVADEKTCESYGMERGSELFGNCLLQLDLAREDRNNQRYYYGPRVGTGVYFMR